jgi:hypothetical protein
MHLVFVTVEIHILGFRAKEIYFQLFWSTSMVVIVKKVKTAQIFTGVKFPFVVFYSIKQLSDLDL